MQSIKGNPAHQASDKSVVCRFMQPMEEELREVGQAMAALGDAVVAVLGERGAARDMESLQRAIAHVQDKR